MLYVYRHRNSTGARDLAEGVMLGVDGGVRGIPARRTKGASLRALTHNDQVICWGDHFAAPVGVRTLNNVEPVSKFAEAQKLQAAGVPTVAVSRTRPAVTAAARAAFVPETLALQARQLTEDTAQQLITTLMTYRAQQTAARQAYNAQPAVPTDAWLPRKNNHVGGNDLLEERLTEPDFYSRKENIVKEYRIHMFKNKSIRAGKKVARPTRPDGRTAPHQWIRSFDAGWVIQYDNFESTKPMRKLATKALKALGLDFGAIDIGKKADGTLIVLEVNRAPGVEGGTVSAYAKHIINWVQNPVSYEREEE